MAITHVASAVAGSTTGNAVTVTQTTTGADFMAVVVSWYNLGTTPVVTDTNGNTWTGRTIRTTGDQSVQVFDCAAPIVGIGHGVTATGTGSFPCMWVGSFAGVHATPHDAETGNTTASGTSLTTGSLTPSQADSLLIAGYGLYTATGISVDGGFGYSAMNYGVGTNLAAAGAYLIQSGGPTAANPAASWTGACKGAAAIVAYKPAGGGASGHPALRRLGLVAGCRPVEIGRGGAFIF